MMVAVHVNPGDTLSGIAAEQGVSLSSLEAANPQFSNPNVIYAGQGVNLPGGGTGSVTATLPQPRTPAAPVQNPASPSSVPSGSGARFSIPGMPQPLADCIAFRESTNDTNPAANGNAFGIIPASGYNVAGDSLAQQEQVAGQIYAQSGGAAWSADGCSGT